MMNLSTALTKGATKCNLKNNERMAEMAAKTFTPKEIAEDLGTDGKTLRKFLRSTFPEAAPGKGNRWALTSKQVREVKKGFKVWDESRRAPKAEDEVPSEEDPEVPTGDPQESDTTDAHEDSDWETDGTLEEVDLDDEDEVVDLELDEDEIANLD